MIRGHQVEVVEEPGGIGVGHRRRQQQGVEEQPGLARGIFARIGFGEQQAVGTRGVALGHQQAAEPNAGGQEARGELEGPPVAGSRQLGLAHVHVPQPSGFVEQACSVVTVEAGASGSLEDAGEIFPALGSAQQGRECSQGPGVVGNRLEGAAEELDGLVGLGGRTVPDRAGHGELASGDLRVIVEDRALLEQSGELVGLAQDGTHTRQPVEGGHVGWYALEHRGVVGRGLVGLGEVVLVELSEHEVQPDELVGIPDLAEHALEQGDQGLELATGGEQATRGFHGRHRRRIGSDGLLVASQGFVGLAEADLEDVARTEPVEGRICATALLCVLLQQGRQAFPAFVGHQERAQLQQLRPVQALLFEALEAGPGPIGIFGPKPEHVGGPQAPEATGSVARSGGFLVVQRAQV